MAEISRLAVTYHRAPDVTCCSCPGISIVSLELDQLTSLTVAPDLEAAATILGIAFRITDIKQIVERNGGIFRSHLPQNILNRMEAVWGTSRSGGKLLAGVGKQTADGDRTRRMGSRQALDPASNYAERIAGGLVRSRPSATSLLTRRTGGRPVGVAG